MEDELRAQFRLDVVHLRAQQRQLRLLVHQQADAVLHHLLVELLPSGGVVEGVGEAVAAALANAHSQADLEKVGKKW